jgi:hypothetical protein
MGDKLFLLSVLCVLFMKTLLSLNSFTTLSLGKVLPLVLEFIPLRLQLLMRPLLVHGSSLGLFELIRIC